MIVNRTDALCNFQFEDNTTNSTGGTTGTVTGTTQYATSISGKAFDFDGSTRVEFGNSSLANTSDLTIFMRMNLDDPASTGDRIFAKRTSGNSNGFFFVVTTVATNLLTFRVRNAADSSFVDVTATLPEANLYAIRCEINLSSEITLSYYQTDGTFTTNTTAFADATYTTNADNITIGDLTGGSNGMDGLVDDFTVVTSILTDEDFYRYYLGLGITDL